MGVLRSYSLKFFSWAPAVKHTLIFCSWFTLLSLCGFGFIQMMEPQYQELLKADIPHVIKDGIHVAVIAGEALGTSVSHCTTY